MTDPPVLDSNVLLRHLLNDHPEHSPQAKAYIGRIERGEQRVRAVETVVFETVFILERAFRRPRGLIRDGVLGVIDLPGVLLPGKRRLRRAFHLYVEHNIPFADAFHAAVAEEGNPVTVVSFDRHFDRIPGLDRIEP